jgi:Fe-S-cluster containining protein
MNIKEFSYNLLKIYQEMSDSFSFYQSSVGLNCLPSCGRCCMNPEIEASLHEMIPMALVIFKSGKCNEWIDKLTLAKNSLCLALIPGEKEGEGKCGYYQERPSLCRMFGVAGYINKHHKVSVSICKYIKEAHQFTNFPTHHKEDEIPIMSDWSLKLMALDPRLNQDKMPINNALLLALEKVALYAQYRPLDTE